MRQKRALDWIFNGEGIAEMTHLLPHYPEPDLVFGHISGVPAQFPREMLEPDMRWGYLHDFQVSH